MNLPGQIVENDFRTAGEMAMYVTGSGTEIRGNRVTGGARFGLVALEPDGVGQEDVLREGVGARRLSQHRHDAVAVPVEPVAAHDGVPSAVENDPRRGVLVDLVVLHRRFEALVRWRHPEQGPVSPAAFIPLAESTGLVVAIDRIVWRQAAAAMKRLHDRFPKELLTGGRPASRGPREHP